MKKRIELLAVFVLITLSSFAQYTLVGTVLDAQTFKPLENVHISTSLNNGGTVTNVNGRFEIQADSEKIVLKISQVGYKPETKTVLSKSGINDLGNIFLTEHPYPLDEITINAGLSTNKDLPVSVTSINSRVIGQELGDQPLPVILNSTPGVFGIRDGGGSGDAKLSIRGFHQENLSLLLNGIPINGEENGLVYWSNWLGLSNAASEIQIQKGAGLSNASIYAVGGSVNIITKNPKKDKSGSLSFETSSYGNINTNITLNSGLLDNGWSITTMIGFGKGKGWVDATYVKSMSYFFTANKSIKNHNLTITLLGAPQTHGQRTLKLSKQEVELHGLKFNKDWGPHNGGIKNASENFYHKPFLSINDDFQINSNNKLSTSVYLSYGYGGGLWSESFNYAPSIFSYRNNSGQIDWSAIYENNATNQDTYTLDNGETVTGYSINAQTKFLASHIQSGIMMNYEHKINNQLKFLAGTHYRYFNSFVREQIDDLLGGKFYIEDYSWSLSGVAGRNQIKTVGDIIKVDNNTIINFLSAWTQLLYEKEKTIAFVSLSANNNWYQRVDRFNYISDQRSKLVAFQGFDARAGVTYSLTTNQNIYINGSYISKAPYFKYVFGNFTNVVVKDIQNENAKSIEAGYRFNNRLFGANLTAYFTQRSNVSMLSNEYVQLENNSQTRAMINGLNSRNMGLEFEGIASISNNIRLGAWFSAGNFKWQNNVSASLFNDNNVVVDTVNVMVKDLYIGGTAQNQFGIFTDIEILKTFFFKTEFQYYSDVYANFNPEGRTDPSITDQPTRFPDYGILNAYLGIPFQIRNGYFGRLQINGYNILDKKYIVTGEDGTTHTMESFRGFWSMGRNLTFSLTINF